MLEEDGTEVDEEEYFQYIPHRTCLIVMSRKESWSPLDTWQGTGPDNPSTSLSSENLAEALFQHLMRVQVEHSFSLCSQEELWETPCASSKFLDISVTFAIFCTILETFAQFWKIS